MAKKKKNKYGYNEADSNSRFAPGGNAVAQWEAEQRNAQTQGHTQIGTGKRFNTTEEYNKKHWDSSNGQYQEGLSDTSVYKPIRQSTYETYVGTKLAKAKRENPNSKINITTKDISNFDDARAKLYNIDPKANLERKDEFTSRYKADVDKAYSLDYMLKKAQTLDLGNTQDQVRRSYNDLNAVKELADTRKGAEGLLKDVEEYRKKYGDSPELKVIEDRAKGISDFINTNAKGGSAVSNEAQEEWKAPLVKSPFDDKTKTKAEVKQEYKQINDYNLEEKFGNPLDLGYEGVKKIKAETPAEQDWKEEKQLQLDPIKKYEDNKKEIEKLEGDSDYDQNIDWSGDEEDAKEKRLTKLKQENAQIEANGVAGTKDYLEKKANITSDEKWALYYGGAENAEDSEHIQWVKGDKYAPVDENSIAKVEDVKKSLMARGLSDSEAELLINIEKNKEYTEQKQALQDIGRDIAKDAGVIGNIGIDVAQTLGSSVEALLDTVTGDGEQFHQVDVGRDYGKTEGMSAAGKKAYEIGSTAATIAAVAGVGALTGGIGAELGAAPIATEAATTAATFGQKAANDSYYNAIDMGASKDDALKYGVASGLVTTAVMTVGIRGLNKLTSKVNGGALKEVFAKASKNFATPENFVADSFVKSALKAGAKNSVKEAATFSAINFGSKVSDVALQIGILNKKSNYYRQYEDLIKQGLSDEEAKNKVIGTITNEVLESMGDGALTGAVLGFFGSAITSGKQFKDYSRLAKEGQELADNAAGKSSYFDGITDQAELERQYRIKGKELHPDNPTGSEEAFKSLVKDKERVEGILSGKFDTKESVEAIDAWETFSNKAKEILGQPKQMTTKMKEQFAKDYGDTRVRLLEVRDNLESVEPTTTEEADNINETISNIDTEIAKADQVVSEVVNTEVEPIEEPNIDITEPIKPQENTAVKNQLEKLSSDLPKEATEKMVESYPGEISPRLYSNIYKQFYTFGKDSQLKSLKDVFETMPEYKQLATEISPEAAGVAFTSGKNTVKELNRVDLKAKPTGKVVNDTGVHNKIVEHVQEKARRTGLDFYITRDLPKYLGESSRDLKGKIEGFTKLRQGKVFLDPDVGNVVTTIEHEVFENIVNYIPDKFAPLEKYITTKGYKILGADAFNDVIDRYKKAYPEHSETELRKEYVCDIAATLMTSDVGLNAFYDGTIEKELEDLSPEERKSVWDSLKEIFDKIVAKLKDYMQKKGVKPDTEFVLDETVEGTKDIKTVEDAAQYGVKLYEELKNKLDNYGVSEDTSVSDAKYSVVIDGEKYNITAEQKELSKKYNKALKENNENEMKKIVKQYATSKGYDTKVYHGTSEFGFTKIDLSKSDDNFSFFATDDLDTAYTYSSKNDVKRISDTRTDKPVYKMNNKELAEIHSDILEKEVGIISKNDMKARDELLDKTIHEFIEYCNEWKNTVDSYGGTAIFNKVNKLYNEWKQDKTKIAQIEKYFKNRKNNIWDHSFDTKLQNIYLAVNNFYGENKNKTLFYVKDDITYPVNTKKGIQDEVKLFRDKYSGNYELYANTDNFLIVNADYEKWNDIEYNKPITNKKTYGELYMKRHLGVNKVNYNPEDDTYVYYQGADNIKKVEDAKTFEKTTRGVNFFSTRELAIIAKNEGFSGVKIENVIDDGGSGDNWYLDPANVYIFFDPTKQVKSADPVTYDNKGDAIPLEKRFDESFDDIRFSVNQEEKALIKEYDKAEKEKDDDKAAEIVENYAALKGYTEKVYHGTNAFGFKQIDISKSEDGISFFATDNIQMAGSYSGEDNVRRISSYKDDIDISIADGNTIANLLSQETNERIKYIEGGNLKERQNILRKLVSRFIKQCDNKYYSQLIKEYPSEYKKYMNLKKAYNEGAGRKRLSDRIDDLGEWENTNIVFVSPELSKVLNNLIDARQALYFRPEQDVFYSNQIDLNKTDSFMDRKEAERKLKNSYDNDGNYELFANTDNFFELDAKGSEWAGIKYNGKEYTTLDIARLAKSKGYYGAIIDNVIDDGIRNSNYDLKPSKVYIFFDPVSQVKSADPFTYDDNGKTIPLEKRFDKDFDDIRFSIQAPTEEEKTAIKEYDKAAEEKDEKKAAELVKEYAALKGYTERVYHGTDYQFGFTKIDPNKSYSKAFFATDDIDTVSTYSGYYDVKRISEYDKTKNENEGNYDLYANTDNFLPVYAENSEYDGLQYGFIKDREDGLKNLKTLEAVVKEDLSVRSKLESIKYNKKENVFEIKEENKPVRKQTPEELIKEYSKEVIFDENKDWEEQGYIWDTNLVVTYAKAQGYDGVVFYDIYDEGGHGFPTAPATVYAFFKPQEQVKSADPFTYDDNGNIIPLEKRFDKDFDDIRFSLNQEDDDTEKQLAKAIRENERLSFIIEKYERELKRTNKSNQVTSKDISKTVQDLKRELDSKIDSKQLFRSINALYTTIAQSGNIKSSNNLAAAEAVIRDILDEPKNTRTEEAKEILSYMYKSPVYIDDKVKKELDTVYGGYGKWVTANKGAITVSTNKSAMDISELWDDLKSKYGDVFIGDPLNEVDKLTRITEIVDQLRNPETLPIEEKMMMPKDDIISTYAVELLTRYANTPKSQTIADELFELRAEKKDAFIKAKIAGKAQGREEQRAKNVLAEANKKERKIDRQVKEYWGKIYKLATEPTYHTKGHLTKGWAKEVANMAELFNHLNENSEEFYRIREENARKRYLDALKNGGKVGELKEKWEYWDNLYNKFNQRLADSCNRLADILEGEDGLVENEVLRDNLRELAKLVAPNSEVTAPYQRLTYDEKLQLVNIARGILKENEYMNKIRGKYKIIGNKVKVRGAESEPTDVLDVSGAIEQAVEELKDTPKPKKIGFVNKFVASIQTPEAIFDRVGGHHKNNIAWQLWKMVEDAQEDEWAYQKMAYDIIEPVLKETDKVGRLRAKDIQKYDKAHLVDLGVKGINANGEEVDVKVPRDIMLDIYSHISKPQNLRHLAIGGYTVPEYKGYYQNDYDKAFGDGQVLIPGITRDLSNFRQRIREARDNEDLAKADELTNQMYNLIEWQTDKWKNIYNSISEKLTPYDRAVLEAGSKFYDKSSKWLGKTSDQMYGVDLFNDENGVPDYYPMHVDKAYLGADIDYGAGIETNLGTSGFAQRRVNSDKPLLGGGYVKTLLDHIAKTSKYYAYLIPQHNLNNVLNGQVNGYSDNFKKLLEQRDRAALNYIERLKRDMFGGGGILHDGLADLFSKATGIIRTNYSAAVLNLNPSVALYQHLSFFMFLVEGGYKNTAKGLVLGGKNKDLRKMIDDATLFLWDRDNKGGMVETQAIKMDRGLLPDAMKYINRITKGHLDWIHNSDMRTVTRGGGVAKFELLEQGYDPSDVEEWNKQFREVYRRLMRTGQPLADTWHRPELQRSNHEIVKFVAMFYTVRLQMLNTAMLENARYKVYKQDYKDGKYNTTKEDVERQKGRAKRSIVAILLSQGSVVAVKMLIAGLLFHQNYDFEDEDGNVTPASIAKGFLIGTAKSMFELIPLASEIEKIANTAVGVLSGDTYSSSYEGISLSGVDAFKDMINNFARDLKKIVEGKYEISKDLDKDIRLLSQMLGIPYGSLSKVIKGGLIGTYNDLKDDDEFNYSDQQNDTQKINLWIKGNISDNDMKDYLVEDNKQKISNAFKKLYLDGEIDDNTVITKMTETGLWDSSTRKQPTNSYIQGKIEWWNIEDQYKDKYVATLTDNGALTAESNKVISEISKMPYSNAFWTNPEVKTTWKSYKSPYDKLVAKVKKWHKE